MIVTLALAILKRILGRPELKERIISGLRAEANKSETKIDDQFVDMFEEAWAVVIPVVLTKF
jgi:hypothetical protein